MRWSIADLTINKENENHLRSKSKMVSMLLNQSHECLHQVNK